ncbi:adenine deaminase [Planomicrobium sp. CPCC 101079]|uniref:adenine deaminase n=1 Tax=Planomicrobium sp. CPCC 101079 TaxID=2599618 RepID=UPI0011B41246|nr:adenine deaminase [Planomicrobium sp. CPCC 101079]TWT14332.1 adenine deaminase [Planomicrobium sp. CPCC 101079]
MKKERLTSRILASTKQKPADLVIRNGRIVNVFTKELTSGDIAITDGVVVGIGNYSGIREIDANGRFVAPGLIDAHVHIESSMVTPHQFSQIVLPHGVTSVITDPHEIANVMGAAGIDFMLNDSESVMLDIFVMLPSCVPATAFENSGAVLSAKDLQQFIKHERVLGIAEVMDFPAVLRADNEMLEKLLLSAQRDGHAAGLKENDLNVYRTAGISTDHECVTKEEVIERLRRGMYVMLREGSVAKNLEALLEAVTEANAHRCLFCTDDKHLDDLIDEGSIDYNVRTAIRHGLNPITAISMASLHAAQCYGLHMKGAVAPGYDADLILLDNLEEFAISEVYKNGVLVGQGGAYAGPIGERISVKKVRETVNIAGYTKNSLQIHMAENTTANVIGINPNNLVTEHLIEKVETRNGHFVPSIEKDLLKIAVIERHKATGNIGLGIVKGLGLKRGAIATTVAHDSHNIIAAGANDEDILTAVKALQNMEGGLVVVDGGNILAELPLAVAGLMSEENFQRVYEQIKTIDASLMQLGAPTHFNAFLTLSFLSLPVIPHLKITDCGLFKMAEFQHISVPVAK